VNKKRAFPNSLTANAFRRFLRGEEREWTAGDWYVVLVKFPVVDIEEIATHLLLDYTGRFGRHIASTVLLRRSLAKADAIGSECFCIYHDCDSKDCPPEAHDDD